MPETFTTQRMLALRKLTRAAADHMSQQLKDALSALVPLLQPKAVLGDYVRGTKDPVRGADALFKSISEQYQEVTSAKPFGVTRELTAPVDLRAGTVEISAVEYAYGAQADGVSKDVRVTSPFTWVLSYTGYSPEKLRTLLASSSPSNEDLHSFALHYVALRSLMLRQAPLINMFAALRYGVSEQTQPEFGKLPLIYISAPISTVRPPDGVIIETTELTGSDGFEEVIDLNALVELRDPLREGLVELANAHGEKL